jgi:DNA uptake protein ComE-like DNA-binding protein
MHPDDASDTNEWLIVPSRGHAGHSTQPDPPEADAPRKESLDRALSRLSRRVEALEARSTEAQARAESADARVEDALRLEKALRSELDSMRAEMSRREQIAQRGAFLLGDAAAQRGAPRRDVEDTLRSFPDLANDAATRIATIEERVRAADRTVRALANDHGSAGDRIEAAEPDPAPPEPNPESETSRLDINRIGFEQLRELGLSVTQAARLLAKRDAQGNFRSLEEINDLLDFPREIIERLKRTLRASG